MMCQETSQAVNLPYRRGCEKAARFFQKVMAKATHSNLAFIKGSSSKSNAGSPFFRTVPVHEVQQWTSQAWAAEFSAGACIHIPNLGETNALLDEEKLIQRMLEWAHWPPTQLLQAHSTLLL